MGRDGITLFVETWTIVWTVLLALGYAAELTPWPGLRVLRSPRVARILFASSTAVVFGFTLAGSNQATSTLATWAILFSSLNWLFHYFRSME
jgi:hypothetical protein